MCLDKGSVCLLSEFNQFCVGMFDNHSVLMLQTNIFLTNMFCYMYMPDPGPPDVTSSPVKWICCSSLCCDTLKMNTVTSSLICLEIISPTTHVFPMFWHISKKTECCCRMHVAFSRLLLSMTPACHHQTDSFLGLFLKRNHSFIYIYQEHVWMLTDGAFIMQTTSV